MSSPFTVTWALAPWSSRIVSDISASKDRLSPGSNEKVCACPASIVTVTSTGCPAATNATIPGPNPARPGVSEERSAGGGAEALVEMIPNDAARISSVAAIITNRRWLSRRRGAPMGFSGAGGPVGIGASDGAAANRA